VAEFRLVGVEQDLHLGDRIEADRRVHAVGARQLVAVQPIDRDLIPVLPHSADVGDLRSEAVAHRFDVRLVVHARQQPQQVDDVAPAALDLRDLGRRQEAGVIAVLRLDGRALGDDRHHFRDPADIQFQAPQIHLAAGVDHVVRLFMAAESGQLDLHGVGSRRDALEGEGARSAADGRPDVGGGFVDQGHGGAGDDLAGVIHDGARDRAGALRGREGRGQREDGAGAEHGRPTTKHPGGRAHHGPPARQRCRSRTGGEVILSFTVKVNSL
jgi:hypothetical protein